MHRFLSVLESEMEETIGVESPRPETNEAQANYEEMDIKPTSIQKGKTEHKEAVQTLAEAVTQKLEDSDTPKPEQKTPVEA